MRRHPRLSHIELNCLWDIKTEGGHMSAHYHAKTLNSLEKKGYIAAFNKANGKFWEITDAGYIRIECLNPNLFNPAKSFSIKIHKLY